MPRRPHLTQTLRQRPGLAVAGAVVCLSLFLAACTPSIDSPSPSGNDARACDAFIDSLPDQVGDQDRRDVDGRFVAAYGEPPIVLRCGVPDPDEASTTCVRIDELDWSWKETDGEVVAVTYGRTPLIEVTIPSTYAGSSAALVDVADAIEAQTERHEECL